jgi:hypothetical protein
MKVEPSKLYAAWQGFSTTIEGVPYTFPRGTRLKGSHPAVRKMGADAFVEDGTPEPEWPHVLDDVVEAADEAARQQDPKRPESPLLSRPLRDFVRVTWQLALPDGQVFRVGELVPSDHWAVLARPEAFGPVLVRG